MSDSVQSEARSGTTMYSGDTPGAGMYSEWCGREQEMATHSVSDLLLQCLDKITPVSPTSPITIADYGAADGGMSLSLFNRAIDHIQDKHGQQQPVFVVYEDQTLNDFNSLFRTIHGIKKPDSLLYDGRKHVYAVASGTSMYEQCMPGDSVDIVFSSSALHWLSKREYNVRDEIFYLNVSDPDKLIPLKQQAAKDWEQFLLHRSNELKIGGSMVLAVMASNSTDEEEDFSSPASTEVLTSIWKSFVSDGIITQDEFEKTWANLYLRTREELMAPFTSTTEKPPAINQLTLRLCEIVQLPPLDSLQTVLVPVPEVVATTTVNAYRSFFYFTFFSALSPDRDTQERDTIVKQLFQKLWTEIVKAPSKFPPGYILAKLVIEKTG